MNIQKPRPGEYNPYFQKYIDLVKEGDFFDLWDMNTVDSLFFFQGIPMEKHNYRYLPGKWTVKEVLMHVIDTDRVMGYRALAGIRGDAETPLYNMDENFYAAHVDVSRRGMDGMLEEFTLVRDSIRMLFEHTTEEQSTFKANAITYPISPRALGYIIMGHMLHHIGVVKERYLF